MTPRKVITAMETDTRSQSPTRSLSSSHHISKCEGEKHFRSAIVRVSLRSNVPRSCCHRSFSRSFSRITISQFVLIKRKKNRDNSKNRERIVHGALNCSSEIIKLSF